MGYQKRNAGISDHTDPERGANLVEFAVLAPLLILLVLGIVEFGWLFGQNNAVKHAAGEASRYASVDGGPDSPITAAEIAQRACNDLLGGGGVSSLTVAVSDGGGSFGDDAAITVTAQVTSLSGLSLITSFLPTDLEATATFRLEQDATWSSDPAINLDPTTCAVIP